MIKDISLTVSPEAAADDEVVKCLLAKKLNVPFSELTGVTYLKKSIDARRGEVKFNLLLRAFIGERTQPLYKETVFKEADKASVIVVGAGPAGLFAALTLLEEGYKPIVLERGKDVHERKKDIASFSRTGSLNEESNYAFGEGGAGAFSDGKLFTRSDKRGDVKKVLSLLVQHGAKEEILYEAHPHIGSDKLPHVVENIRKTIIKYGGEVHFESRVVSLIKHGERVNGAICSDGREYIGPVILATGHSAKDVYLYLDKAGFTLEKKDTAIGVRLEHPQALIDSIQYHRKERGPYLPPATYRYATQVDGRGVYSFCMCPGGFVISAASEKGLLAVNGMSSAKRNSPYANSGMIVQLRCEDLKAQDNFAMLRYIESIERSCYLPFFKAPAQRMDDFISKRASSTLPKNSYIRGTESIAIDEVLPPLITNALREGFKAFDSACRGRFITSEALLIAPETRTSSPVKIARGERAGFYPAGEGSGMAGGIVSAAIDGTEVAKTVIRDML